jgi:hypothetical protein
MSDRKGLAMLAACAAMACAGLARAQAAPSSGDATLRPLFLEDATQPAPPPAATPKPLMGLLDQIGIGKGLEDSGINIYGFVEGGYTYSASAPPGNVINGYVFNTKHERIVLDQADITIERTVDAAAAAKKGIVDIGARFEAIYGWDTGLVHSNGLYDNPATLGVTKGYYKSRTSPENQFDINQAYLDIALPVGNGLRLRAGKFVTLLGEEVINPTGNPLYSHSYLFGFAIPFTHTGIIGEYKLNDDVTIDAGVTRGWNQSIKDNNGDPDFLGGITFTPQESDFLKKWKFIVNASVGPQATKDNSDWWTVIDLQAYYAATDKLSFSVNADYGDAPHVLAPKSAQWFGVAGYAGYVLNDNFTLNGRVEWYDDNNGFTLGFPGVLNVYEATVGLAIKPFPSHPIGQNLVIRPEVRFDYADKRFFDAGTDHYQFSAAIDAYFTF